MGANHGVAGFNGGNVRTNNQWFNVKEVGKKCVAGLLMVNGGPSRARTGDLTIMSRVL